MKTKRLEMNSFMALYAFRYVLGRMSYAPSDVQEELRRIWPDLNYETREVIARDLAEEINRDARLIESGRSGCLGMDMDRKGWLAFRDWVSEQEAKDA